MTSVPARPRAIRWYFSLSAVVLAVDAYFAGWPIFEGQVLHRHFEYDPSAAPTWLDYTEAVFTRLGVKNRVQAAIVAHEAGLSTR